MIFLSKRPFFLLLTIIDVLIDWTSRPVLFQYIYVYTRASGFKKQLVCWSIWSISCIKPFLAARARLPSVFLATRARLRFALLSHKGTITFALLSHKGTITFGVPSEFLRNSFGRDREKTVSTQVKKQEICVNSYIIPNKKKHLPK